MISGVWTGSSRISGSLTIISPTSHTWRHRRTRRVGLPAALLTQFACKVTISSDMRTANFVTKTPPKHPNSPIAAWSSITKRRILIRVLVAVTPLCRQTGKNQPRAEKLQNHLAKICQMQQSQKATHKGANRFVLVKISSDSWVVLLTIKCNPKVGLILHKHKHCNSHHNNIPRPAHTHTQHTHTHTHTHKKRTTDRNRKQRTETDSDQVLHQLSLKYFPLTTRIFRSDQLLGTPGSWLHVTRSFHRTRPIKSPGVLH